MAFGLLLASALPAQQGRPARGQQDDRPLRSVELTVEDLGTGAFLPSLRRGDHVVIRPGQQIRLRMTGTAGPNAATRYPSTEFKPGDGRSVRVDRINPDVGTIILTGVQPQTGSGAFVVEYQITDPMPIGDDRERTGRIYVRVEADQPAPSPPPPPSAGRLGVTLFVDENYRGRSQTFYEDDQDLRDNPIQSDTVSSVRVDPGCRAILFEDVFYGGRSAVIDRDVATMRGTGVGNDTVSSLRVECGGATRGITVFVDAGYRGASELLGPGDYATLSRGMNDEISSIRVDRGCRATLYRDTGFRGGSWTIEQDASTLDGSPVGNDSISSIRVVCDR